MSHKHTFRQVAHLDSCHTYTSVYACKCGAGAQQSGEREMKSGGWFLDPECARCIELLDGADTTHTFRQWGPKGRLVKNVTEVRPQEEAA